ncbi:uncharacterized protein CPUR_08718 [Claviceps purpurea 20.1]|uniref:Uncharacterized protein n=1 Tax=Claviceps purpurea (strain 20.1) TaxID=1111077 RepID=M1WGR3_CLAP2|nr:uncharacterized protein CPUR_08718 [Claviceps purpurea 20.1]
MIPKRNPMLRILNQPIQRLHDLRQIGPPIIRVKVEIKRIHLVSAFVHKNHDTGSRIGRPARFVRHITHQPRRQGRDIVFGRKGHSPVKPVEQREIIKRQGRQIRHEDLVNRGVRVADVGTGSRAVFWAEAAQTTAMLHATTSSSDTSVARQEGRCVMDVRLGLLSFWEKGGIAVFHVPRNSEAPRRVGFWQLAAVRETFSGNYLPDENSRGQIRVGAGRMIGWGF